MAHRNLLTTFLIAVPLAVGSPGEEPVVDSSSSTADTISLSDSATRLPEVNEFVPVEIIAEMIHYKTPQYPRLAVQSGAQGLVWIKALVSSKGEVLDAVVYKTSGNPYLDEAAANAAPGCRFKPAIQGGKPVAMWVTYKVEFILSGSAHRPSDIVISGTDIKSRVDKAVWSIRGDSITVTTSKEKSQAIDPKKGQQFDILMLRETDETRPGRQKAMVLIDGGCASGLKIGMTGEVWGWEGDDYYKLANVEVTDVQPFESLCSMESLRRRRVSMRDRVTFPVKPLDKTELLSLGETYYTSGQKERALACFEAISDLADSNALVRARLEECRDSFFSDLNPRTVEDSAALQRRIPGWLTVAGAYIRLDKADHARRLARKILAIDSTSKGGQELLGALDASDACKFDLNQLFFGKGDTTTIDQLPEMLTFTQPEVIIPPLEYLFKMERPRHPDTVWVRALISSGGDVMKAEVHRSSKLWGLDLAAVTAAYGNKFKPGISCGRPLAMWVKWKVEFWLESG